MTRLADLLCGAGHRVVRADLRGFGEAEADVAEATIHEHYRRIERGLHVDDLRAVTAGGRRRRAARAVRKLRRSGRLGAGGRGRRARTRRRSGMRSRWC